MGSRRYDDRNMHHYSVTLEIARPLAEVFAFFRAAKNLAVIAPPELNLELLSAPEILEAGATLVWKGRRWGIAQQIAQQVTLYDDQKRIVIEQIKGPLRHWNHTHHFDVSAVGTLL